MPEQKNILWNSKHSQNQSRFQLLASLPVLSGIQHISCHPGRSLWILLHQNELIAKANARYTHVYRTPLIRATYGFLHKQGCFGH